MQRVQNLVIGAGPAGLAAAYALQGDTLVLEKDNDVGGLCRSIEHDGGIFDIGGHSFHTPYPDVADLLDRVTEGGLYRQKRDARVYALDTLIPYPFQQFYELLPDPDVVRECELGLREVESCSSATPENFEEYIVQRFGPGIAKHFMLPYNRKLWARDIRSISCEWTSERVAAAKGATESFEERGGERTPLQPDTRVGYPATGGFQEIFHGLARHVPRLETSARVIAIDPARKGAVLADGREISWERLVTTVPLPELVRMVTDVPDFVVAAANALSYMSLRVELLLVGRRLDTEIQRIYSGQADIPPHKIALNHNSSDALRGREHHAIMAEVSVSPEKRVDVDEIAPRTIDLLCEVGVLKSPSDVIWTGHVDVEYAYPVYTHERPSLVTEIKDWLGGYQIYTVGRFGDWEYVNSDKCVHKGLSLGLKLAAGGLLRSEETATRG